jgi:hypothetical protein
VPSATTVYTLTATNSTGTSATATTQVLVTGSSTPITPPTPPTTGGVPVVNYFDASPSTIFAGDSATLNWNVSNATSISIDHGVGPVSSSGITTVYPTMSTKYTLTAINTAGSSIQSATVFVSGVPPQSFAVTSVTVSADPPSFSGACPTTVNFYGDIAVSGSGTVTYRWESSEGGTGSMQSINFLGASLQEVSISLQADTTGSYWVRLHIFTPNEILSNQANFTLNCASAPGGVWAGTWETTYGTMVLTQTGNQVSGYYEHSNGHITGTVSGNVLYGTWSEAPTYAAPDNAGDVQLTISPDGKTFTGGWRYGSSGSWNMNWNGTTIF